MNNTYDVWSDPDPTRELAFMVVALFVPLILSLLLAWWESRASKKEAGGDQ